MTPKANLLTRGGGRGLAGPQASRLGHKFDVPLSLL